MLKAVGTRARWAAWMVLLLLGLGLSACDDGESDGGDKSDGGRRPRRDAGTEPNTDSSPPTPPPQDASPPTSTEDAETPRPPAAWTVLVYMAADNNLEKAGIDDLNEMLATPASPDVHVVVQIDRTKGFYDLGVAGVANWDTTKRFRVGGGVLEEVADMGELDTGSAKNLSDFLTWGFRMFPSERRAIVLWDHGNAWRGYGGDDTSDKDQLDQQEIGQGIKDGLAGAGLSSVDLIGFDACLMSSDATAALIKGFTRYLVASEELVPGHGWDYSTSVKYLVDNPTADAPSFAKKILEAFNQQARANQKQREITINLLDLDKMDAVTSAMGKLLDVAEANLAQTARDIAAARAATLDYGHHADPSLAHNMFDIGDFASHLASRSSVYGDASSSLQSALKSLVVASIYGSYKQRSTGLSVYFPPGKQFYDPHYDAVPEAERWRAFLKKLYDLSGTVLVEPPSFDDPYQDKPVGGTSGEPPAQGSYGCDLTKGPYVQAYLSQDDHKHVATATLLGGFVESESGKIHVFIRTPAKLDEENQTVRGDWDRHVLVAQQGSRVVPLFSEVTLDSQGRYAIADIPFVYSEPVACPCALVGTPGYSDVDSDGMPDCADEDVDADGVADKLLGAGKEDNCPWVANPDQRDSDGNGVGDACASASFAPTLGCQPEPSGQFGKTLPAVWRVVIDRHDRVPESDTLYVMDDSGSAELTPEVGGLLWPHALVIAPSGVSAFQTQRPLPFNLHDPVVFDFADAELLYAQNAAGDPLLDASLNPIPLLGSLGFDQTYLHLELDDFAGNGDIATSVSDTSACDPPVLDLCPGAEVPDCTGTCVSAALRKPNGVCDDGTQGRPSFNCELLNFDDGECARPGCPGDLVRDCNGQCTLPVATLGNGTCDALAQCRALGWDQGDCVCGPACSGNGTCGATGCTCTGGFNGAFCDRPPTCGDGTCAAAGNENCVTCAADCGACPVACGDGACRAGDLESCANCAADCGMCRCGDGVCTGGVEDCTTCASDCGSCPTCGDFVCAKWSGASSFPKDREEHCANCPSDCGTCQGDCCAAAGAHGDATSRVGCGLSAIAQCVCALDATCCNREWTAQCGERAVRDCALTCAECSAAEGFDADNDFACGSIDNCPNFSNSGQADSDEDGVGDACDRCEGDDTRDADRDRIPDACDLCPHHPDNPETDGDGDGVGDACDTCPTVPNANRDPRACADGDGDKVFDFLDNCPEATNADQADTDQDGRGNVCDNCVAVANFDQTRENGGPLGDACFCQSLPEECGNAIDDDCDGIVDEGCSCQGVPEVCNGVDDDCDDFVDDGCRGCVPQIEICDGADNDCNEFIDNGCSCFGQLEECSNAIDDNCNRLVDERPCALP